MAANAFTIPYLETAISDLKRRLGNTRTSRLQDEVDPAYGISLHTLRDISDYWRDSFVWEAKVRELRKQPHFVTAVRGHRIHFLHYRKAEPNPRVLLLTHGWPSSFLEFEKIVPMLTDPVAFGGLAEDAFDVVIPSLPGFGYSEISPKAALGFFEVAEVWAFLMSELGYERFGVQGGDIGAGVNAALGLLYPERLTGIHFSTMPPTYEPFLSDKTALSDPEQAFLGQQGGWLFQHGAYALLQATRPATVARGLEDSPIGMAAWILEKYRDWSDCGGNLLASYTPDQLSAFLTLYWTTQTIGTSVMMYAEIAKRSLKFGEADFVATPCAFASFPADSLRPPQSWLQRGFNIQQWSTFERGGHFAALEEPWALAQDIRSFFRV